MRHSTRTIDVNQGPARGGARSFARVTDSFVAPAKSRSGLHSLGKALGIAGQAVSAVEAEKRAEAERADERRGMLEGLSLSMNEDPAKIKSGELYPQASPAFMAGLRQSQASAWGYEQIRKWEVEYQEWEGRNSNDPGAYTAWMNERLNAATAAIGTDEFAIAGALPILQQGLNNMSAKHTAYTAARVQGDEMTAMQGIALGIMETFDWQADPSGQGLIRQLAFQADLRVAKGMDGTAINQQMIDDVLNYADAMNDTRFLAALAQGHDDGTYRLSAAQMKQVDDKLLNIEGELDAVARDNAAAQAKRIEQENKASLNAYQDALMADPMAMPDEAMPAELYKSALGLRSAVLQARNAVDPDLEAAALAQLYGVMYGPEFKAMGYADQFAVVVEAIASPDTQFSEGTISNIMKHLRQTAEPSSALNNSTITKLRSNSVASMKILGGGIISMGNENQLAVAFSSAYDNALIGFDLSDKTPIEIQAIHNEITKHVMLDLLSRQDTRFQLLDNFDDNPDLVRQFGLQDYMAEYYSRNPGQKADDELRAITGD